MISNYFGEGIISLKRKNCIDFSLDLSVRLFYKGSDHIKPQEYLLQYTQNIYF